MFELSFPGLGINGWEINPVAFNLGMDVMWYGVVIALGMLLAIAYASYRCKQHGIKVDDLIDIAIFTIFFGVIGARLYYVALNASNFKTFADVINIRSGGLAILGGVAFGAVTIFVVCWIKKISWRKLFDCAGPGVMIAQAIGRLGNFFNGEAYGSVTDLPWRMSSKKFANELLNPSIKEIKPITVEEYQQIVDGTLGVHPTFLYESLWNILGFIIINLLYKKKKFDGQIALYYLGWYGLGRMFIEGLRTDPMMIGDTGIRSNQLLAFLIFAVSVALLICGLIYVKNHPNSSFAVVGFVNSTNETVEDRSEEEEEKEEDSEENARKNKRIWRK